MRTITALALILISIPAGAQAYDNPTQCSEAALLAPLSGPSFFPGEVICDERQGAAGEVRPMARLTEKEIEALLAASGNVDPCMFDEWDDVAEGEQLHAAWLTGQEKLREMLAGKQAQKRPRRSGGDLLRSELTGFMRHRRAARVRWRFRARRGRSVQCAIRS